MIVKGTEYYDGKTRRYVDYPITGTHINNGNAHAEMYFKHMQII